MALELADLDAGGETEYRALVEADPRTLVYATQEFRAFLAAAVGGRPRTVVARRDGRLVGGLTWLERGAGDLGRVLNSLPWYGSHGGCVLAPGEGDDVRRALLEPFRAAAARPDVLSATMILTADETVHEHVYADVLAPRATDDRIGQMTALPAPDGAAAEALLGTLRQKTRNLVRKSLKQGFVEVVADDDRAWDFLHATHAENMRAIGGRAKPRGHFDALRATLPTGWLRLSLALLDGTPVAALLLLRFNRTVEYLTPVIAHEHRSQQPLSFLIWHGMLDAARAGYGRWNWGGTWSSQDSLHHFKAGWGAEDRRYAYLVLAHEAGLRRLRAGRDPAREAFPFYYLYPDDRLDGDAG